MDKQVQDTLMDFIETASRALETILHRIDDLERRLPKRREPRETASDATGMALELQAVWNEYCGQLPECKAMTGERLKAATARLRENRDLTYWKGVVLAIANNPFCNGKNDRGWKANFDYFLRPGTHVKVSEGQMGSAKNGQGLDDGRFG